MQPYNYTWDNYTIMAFDCDWELQFPTGYVLYWPETIPFSIFAAVIGAVCGSSIKAMNTKASQVYALSFFMYAVMMVDATFADTIFGSFMNSPNVYYQMIAFVLMWIDMVLTSSIALSFGWNALVDAGFIDENSWKSWAFMLFSYFSTGVMWAYVMATNSGYGDILYIYVIVASCGMYVIGEFVSIVIHNRTDGIMWLFIAGLCGVIGIQGMLGTPPIYCEIVGPYFGDTGLWFCFSDFAMICVYRFFVDRAKAEEKKGKQYVTVVN